MYVIMFHGAAVLCLFLTDFMVFGSVIVSRLDKPQGLRLQGNLKT